MSRKIANLQAILLLIGLILIEVAIYLILSNLVTVLLISAFNCIAFVFLLEAAANRIEGSNK